MRTAKILPHHEIRPLKIAGKIRLSPKKLQSRRNLKNGLKPKAAAAPQDADGF